MSWAKKTLGDICTIQKGKIGIKKATPGEFPLVVTAEERLSHNEYHFEGNAVVIPLVSSTGHGHKSLNRIHFQSGKFAVGTILCAVMPKDEKILRADYLYRFLDLNRENELVGRMKGMANVTLPMKEIAKIEIPVPPIEAQIEFVQKYSVLEEKSNDLGEEIKRQLNLVKSLRQALLREAIQGKLIPQDLNDEPARFLLEKIKVEKERLVKNKKIKKQKPLQRINVEEILIEIPKNWASCKLGEIIELIMGQSPPGNTYNKSGNGLPFFQGKKEFGHIYPTGNSTWCNAPKRISQKDDILIAVRAPVGDVNLSDKEYAIGRGLSIIRCFAKEDLDFWFLFYLLRADQNNWKSKGSFFDAINRDIIENKIIYLPPIFEQKRIVAKLDELMQYCDNLETSIKESQNKNELLLQQVLFEALEPKDKEVAE